MEEIEFIKTFQVLSIKKRRFACFEISTEIVR